VAAHDERPSTLLLQSRPQRALRGTVGRPWFDPVKPKMTNRP